jgi:predicted RNase H-like HicB family nuclease
MPRHYIALIHKEADSGYGISFPDVPGVTAVSETLDDALHEASIALGFAFEDWEGPRPMPRSLDELRADDAFLEQSADAVIAAVAPSASLANAA